MPTKRDFLLGMSLCACCGPFAGGSRAQSAALLADGCEPSVEDLARLRARDPGLGHLGNAEASFSNIRRTTGNAQVDLMLDRAIKRLADTFDVYPGFAFFDDTGAPNAWATSDSLIPGRTYTVLFGENYYRKWISYDPSGISVLTVIAHEFGHIMQYKAGLMAQIRGGLPTPKRVELHADYMSGYYIAILKRLNPDASFWKAGDKFRQIGTYDDKDPSFHGTPEQRVAASQNGFTTGYEGGHTAQDAFRIGMTYVATQ